MSTALTVYQKSDPIAFVDRFGRALNRMVGGQCTEDGEIAALAMICEGLTPIEFQRKYNVICGKPTMKADAMLAEWRLRGGKHRVVERSSERAAIELIDPDGEKTTFELTWKEASESRFPWKNWRDHDEGLKDNWSTPTDRKNMLWARLISDSVRSIAPEIANGIYTPEEMKDEEENTVDGQVVRSSAVDPVAFAAAAAQQVEEPAEEVPFEVKSDGEIVEPEPEPEKEITNEQAARIRQLFVECDVDHEHQEAALKRRGVNSLLSLTREQAAEMIQKMEDYLKKKQTQTS